MAFSRSILPPLGCFTAPFSGLRPRCGSWANVASWVHESRECTWAFIGSSSVSSPSAGGAPPHSLLPALPELFPGGYGFFRRKAFEPTTYSVFRQTEPTARADVASWANESREGTWAFTCSSSVSSPSSGVLYRFIHWPSLARRGFAGKCRRVGQRIPRMRMDIHRLFLCNFSLRWGALPLHSLASARAEGSRADASSANEFREYTWANS